MRRRLVRRRPRLDGLRGERAKTLDSIPIGYLDGARTSVSSSCQDDLDGAQRFLSSFKAVDHIAPSRDEIKSRQLLRRSLGGFLRFDSGLIIEIR